MGHEQTEWWEDADAIKRVHRWVHASRAFDEMGASSLAHLGAMLIYMTQSVGRLDAKLRMVIIERFVEEPKADGSLAEFLDLSRLWVLDAYELVRTLGDCIHHGLWVPEPSVRAGVTDVKRQLAQVRIPLAKLEPHGRSGRALPGSLFAWPVLVPGAGAGWLLQDSASSYISRHDLSDAVLSMLESAKLSAKRDNR